MHKWSARSGSPDSAGLAIKRRSRPPRKTLSPQSRPCRRRRRRLVARFFPTSGRRLLRRAFQDGAPERHRPPQPSGGAGEAQAQEEAPRPVSQLVLHGCQVPGVLQHNYGLQPLPDRRCVFRLPNRALPAHRRKGQAH